MKACRWIVLVVSSAVLTAGCANMSVLPDRNAEAFASQPALTTPAFQKASVAVTGRWYGHERAFPGAVMAAEQQAWHAIHEALAEKKIAALVEGSGPPGDLTILFEFMIEDDSQPMHTSLARLSLYTFPDWKMIRLSARARCRVHGESIPGFEFEEETLLYRSPILLPVAPFSEAAPLEGLFETAGQALAVHLVRNLQRFFPVLIRPHEAPTHAK